MVCSLCSLPLTPCPCGAVSEVSLLANSMVLLSLNYLGAKE